MKGVKRFKTYSNVLRPYLGSSKASKMLKRAIKTNGNKCVYCNCHVIKGSEIKRGMPNQATIDHIYHSYDIRRHTIEGNNKVVLSCKHCNQTLGDKVMYYMSDEYYSLVYPPQDLFTLLNLNKN